MSQTIRMLLKEFKLLRARLLCWMAFLAIYCGEPFTFAATPRFGISCLSDNRCTIWTADGLTLHITPVGNPTQLELSYAGKVTSLVFGNPAGFSVTDVNNNNETPNLAELATIRPPQTP